MIEKMTTLQGANAVGGPLARSDGYSSGNFTNNYYYHADGNGNVTYLETSSQTLAASYRYDAFGNTLSSSGTLAGANTYRFSSKEFITNGSFYCYLYRFYSPSLQRWLNRDPLADGSFLGKGVKGWHGAAKRMLRILATKRVYTFVQNSPTRGVDAFGLYGPGYDAEECAGLQNEMEFLTNLSNQPGVDINSIIEQLNDLQDEYDENCGDDDDGPNPQPQPVPVPVCPAKKPQPAPSFCQRHPALCTAGEIAGGTVVVVGVGILIFGSGGTAAPVVIGLGAAAL